MKLPQRNDEIKYRDIARELKTLEALRQSEARYRMLVNNLPNIVFKGFRDGSVEFFDDKIEALTGYSKEEFNSRKMTWLDIVVDEDLNGMRKSFIRALKTNKSYVREYRIKTKSGDIRWIQEGSQIVCDREGKIEYIGGAFLNITDSKRAEKIQRRKEELEQLVAERTAKLRESLEALKRTQAQLVESGKMAALGNLVAGVAHEINTPLGIGVTAASHLDEKTRELARRFSLGTLKRSQLDEYIRTAEDSTAMILSNLLRAAGLIQSFKQIAVDQSSEELRTFRIKDYIHDVLSSLQPKLKRTSHEVTVRCPEDLQIRGFPGAFSQIITNLVMNSLIHGFEYMEHGRMVFDVSENKTMLLLKYSDNGRGIEKNILEHIFEPFFTTKRGLGGTGLGMHIVYNTVTQTLGGMIQCESVLGKGTTFLIQVPLRRN